MLHLETCHATHSLPSIFQRTWLGQLGVDQHGKIFVKWMNLPPAPDSILEFVNCKCTKKCESNRCSCLKSGMKRTDVCKCTDSKNCKESSSGNESDDSDEDIYNFDESASSSDENEQ